MTKSREAAEQAIARAAAAQARDPNPHGLAPAQIQALHERYALSMPQLVSARPSNRISKFFEGIMPPGATFTAADDMARTAASRRGMLPGGAMLTGTGGNGIMTSPQLPYQPEFACFRAGTQVLLPDGTRKPIEEIRIGDRILDRTGRIQVVENAWCSGIPSEVVEVVTWGKKTFYSTLQHSWPVWSWVRTCQCGCGADVTPGRLYKSGHYKGGTQGDARVHVRGTKARTGKGYQAIPVNYEPLQRMRAEALRAGDFLLMPRKFDAVTTDVSETEARLLGYYTAEGTIDKSRDGLPEAVSFDFGKHEIATWVRDVQDLASSLGIKVSTSLKKSCCHVRTTNDRGQNDAAKRLVALAAMHVGEYSDKKRFSEEVMRWPVKLKRELIRGMFRGDGTQNWRISTKNGHEGRAFGVTYTTVSRTLVDQLQLILAQIGWPSRLTSAQATSRMFPDGKTRECLKAFHLTIPAPFAFDAADFIWGDSSQARRFERREEIRPECMLDDDFVYLPIKSVTRVSNDVPVYNLTVSGDHSYLVDNVATYNSPARQSFPVHRCLIEGTLVQYASGAVGTIEDVQIGDELLGPDGQARKVLNAWRNEAPESLVEIEWKPGAFVKCSKEHRWPTARGLISADQLEVGDVLTVMTADNQQSVAVQSLRVILNEAQTATYDITVSDDHLYCLAGGLVTHNSLANIYWRLFYKLDPVFQTGVNLISEMIFSKFRITGEGIDGEIHDMLEEQVETTQLHAHLAYFPREFLVVGEVIPHLFFDETRGIWTHLTLHDPDRIEVIWSPFLDMDPILQFRPDDELRKIVLSADPILSPIRDSMPEEVFTAIASGENITLSPVNASLLARRMHPYNIRGDSVAAAMWETWMYEDAIRAASIAVARRGACFVAGTPVLTTKGTKAIEDVKIGDRVIAGDGSTQTVEQAWAELKASEGLVEIKALGSPSLFCTPQHRFKIWAAPRTCACGCGTPLEMTYANGKPRRRAFVTGHAGRRNETGQMIAGPTIDWTVYATDPKVRAPSTHQPLQDVEAKDIRKGDYMLVPRKFDQIETSTRLEAARMLGYYVAEGSRRNITKNGEVRCEGVALTFSLAEAETWGRDVMQLASALGLDPILTEYRPSEGTVTASSGREGRTVIYLQKQKDEHFAHWLRTHGGEGSENMCLSEEVMRWPLDLKREFLRGYFRGDGHWGIPDADSPRCLQVTAASTSQSLIYQIRILLAQIGVYGSVSYNPRKHANWNDVWIVSSTGRDARLLANLFWGVRVDPLREEGSGSRTWVDEDYVYVPVQKVERHDDDVVTYNLTVSGDHSYLAGGLQTFNSPLKVAKLGDPATGYIPSPEQEARLMELLAASETDPNCFTPETPVTLADGSHKPIGDVEVGDLVRDRNGKVSEVTAAWSEEADELVRIHVVGSGRIDCTPRHRWPVWRTPDVCQCGCETPIARGNFAPNHGMTGLGPAHRYWRPDTAPYKINDVKVRFLEGYDPHCEVTADQLRRGDYLKLPRRFHEVRPHDVTPDKARLLGYYAAEGNIREIYRRADGSVRLGFDLSFGLSEKDDVVKDAAAIIERVVGFPAYVNPLPERNGMQVASLRNESTPVAEWLRQHAGSLARMKVLSAEVMSWPLDLKYEFLRGYLGGDGCVVQSKDRQGYVEVGSASETLIDQVRLIVTQLGSLASKSWRRQSEKSFGPGNLFYRLHIYGELADRLSKDVWDRDPLPRQKSRSTSWWADDDYVYVPVRKVERVTKPGSAFRVVNISVAGDHSYCVHGGVGTFNSWLVYNYAINFDLVGAQERSWKIEQSAEYVERMKLIALGISKSFLWGEISHASAASGLAVFLKRMRAMRDYFESSWLIPKFFKPISVMNKWVKPTEAELKHNVRVRRSFREVVEDRRYITPRIEWENSLDPSVDSAMIQAMQQLEGIGVKFSRTTKMALVNRDFQTELKQRVEESRFEQETLAANPGLALDGGGAEEGGGGGGGGGMLPGMPPEALGLPPMEEGTPPEMGGEMPPPEPPPASKQSDEGGETAALWDADGRYGSWTKEDATALRQLFRGEVPDDAPWQRMVESWRAKAATDPAARASLLALRLEDTAELWSGVQDWLLVEGYPPEALRQLAEIAASEGLIKVTAAAPDNIPEQFQSDTWLVGMPLKG